MRPSLRGFVFALVLASLAQAQFAAGAALVTTAPTISRKAANRYVKAAVAKVYRGPVRVDPGTDHELEVTSEVQKFYPCKRVATHPNEVFYRCDIKISEIRQEFSHGVPNGEAAAPIFAGRALLVGVIEKSFKPQNPRFEPTFPLGSGYKVYVPE